MTSTPHPTLLRQILGLAGWLLLVFIAAALGSSAPVQAGTFYLELDRPPWSPPAWLFGPVWTILYTMMGIAIWLIWQAPARSGKRLAITLFLVQLAANALWTWIFFAWQKGFWAFAEILILWLLIFATIASFRRISRLGAVLLIPYLAWVSFAAALTWSLWQRNPGVLG